MLYLAIHYYKVIYQQKKQGNKSANVFNDHPLISCHVIFNEP